MNRLLILSLLLSASCSGWFPKEEGRILARVYDEYLYESDLAGVVAPGTQPNDSLQLTRNFINNWIRQRLMIRQAENNLSREQLDFSKQLESYKNSLTIFAYENELVRQKLDTVVSEEDLQGYYESNQAGFVLRESVVQLQYVKLPIKSPLAGQVRKLLLSDTQADRTRLTEICEKGAAEYQIDNESWISFSDVLSQFPLRVTEPEEFLKTSQNVEITDTLHRTLIRFKGYRLKESLSPYTYEKQRIRDIILNKRKMELLSSMQDNVFRTAQQKNDFEIY